MMNSAKSESYSWQSWMFSRMTIFFGLGVVAAGTYVVNPLQSNEKTIKKIPPDLKASIISHTTKTRSPLKATMQLDSDAPEQPGDEFTLVITFETEHDASNIKARWIIPQGIELVRGSIEPVLNELAKGETKQISATFKQLSDTNERIHFKASTIATGMRSSLTLQYNSLDQERIDLEKRNLREVAAEQMKKDIAVDAMQKGKSHSHTHLAE